MYTVVISLEILQNLGDQSKLGAVQDYGVKYSGSRCEDSVISAGKNYFT